MRAKVETRAVEIGHYILETNKTIREAMTEFGVSKSTIHKDIKYRLPELDPELAVEVDVVMARHKAVRHINGGKAFRDKMKMRKAS